MTEASDRRALDILAAEVSDLMWRVHRAQEMIRQAERDDGQALRNFIALAAFANPECLPDFARPIRGGRPPARSPQPQRPVPQGIPYPRQPRDAN